MRLAPVPLFYANNPEIGIMMSGESSRTTHQVSVAIDACRYFGALIIGVLRGNSNKVALVDWLQQAGLTKKLSLKRWLRSCTL
jgi:ADP-ribosyl-[dinitrogen reductase] hydrolase